MKMPKAETLCKHCGEELAHHPENALAGRGVWAHTSKTHWLDKPHKAEPA